MSSNDHDDFNRPEYLLSAAMRVGRELSALLRDNEGCFPHRDRVLVGAVMRAAADRAVLASRFRGPLDGLVDKINRLLSAAAVEGTETVVVGTDEDGDAIYGERTIHFVPAEMRPLVTARELAISLAALIDRAGDVLEAERAVLSIMSARGAR